MTDSAAPAASRAANDLPGCPARPPLAERYRRLFNRRGNDWWSIVFAYPVGRLLVLLVEEVRWVTPSRLTAAGFATKLAAAGWIWIGPGWRGKLAIAFLLQAAQVLDAMDGTLARARRQFSRCGAFLDKSTDGVGFAAIAIAIGHQAAVVTGDSVLASLGGAAAAAFLAICYMHWVARAASSPPGGAEALAGGGPPLAWPAIRREWWRGWLRIVRFGEADSYLWMAILIVLGQWRVCVYLLALVSSVGAVLTAVHHWRSLRDPAGG